MSTDSTADIRVLLNQPRVKSIYLVLAMQDQQCIDK